MKTEEVATLISCSRSGAPAVKKVQKAVKAAGKDPALREQLEEQTLFDERVTGLIRTVYPPPGLVQPQVAPEAAPRSFKRTISQPPILAVLFGVLVMVGLLVYSGMDRMRDFAGREHVLRMLELTTRMTGNEFERLPVPTKTSQLDDWLFLKEGLDDYTVPAKFGDFTVLGARIFRINKRPVAQVAVEEDEMIFFLFRAADFGIDLEPGADWRMVEENGWIGAIRSDGTSCFMAAMPGDARDMTQWLAEVEK